MHPRICVSAICTYKWSLSEDLAFWERARINRVGVSVAKVEAHGWLEMIGPRIDEEGHERAIARAIGAVEDPLTPT
ncbi:MAG: hypothetical protein ACT4OX_14545 [Actinomycetota bacterium]